MSMLAYQNRRVFNDLDRGAPAAMSVFPFHQDDLEERKL
jgi:hypothetical protein